MDLWISAAGGEVFFLLLAGRAKSRNLEINGFMDYWPEAREVSCDNLYDLWITATGGEVYFSCSRGERNPEI